MGKKRERPDGEDPATACRAKYDGGGGSGDEELIPVTGGVAWPSFKLKKESKIHTNCKVGWDLQGLPLLVL